MLLNRFIIICAAVLLLPIAGVHAEETWDRIENQIIEESRQTKEASEYTLHLIQMDRKQLRAERVRLKNELGGAEKTYKAKKVTFQGLLDKEQGLKAAIENEKEEIKNVEDTIYNAAQKAHGLIEESPVSAELPGRFEQLMPLISKTRFPGIEGIDTLVSVLWSEMEASGEIKAYQGQFIGPDYQQQAGKIVRVGSLTAAYMTPGGDIGYLRLGEKKRLVAMSGDLPWHIASSLKDYLKGESGHMPIDISGGTVFKVLSEKKDFQDWLEAGGLLIWPILMVGVVALILALERFIFLLRIRSNSDKFMEQITDHIKKDQWNECKDYCEKRKRYPTCNVLSSVFEHLGVTREVMENAIEEAILRQIPRLERFVATLAILAAIAPLLGLLGTVTGMINTFQVITLFGTGDPKMMSGGISEALVTTQLGLAVAIPIMLLHHFLERRVDKTLGDIEEKGNKIVLTLLKKGVIHEGVTEGAA